MMETFKILIVDDESSIQKRCVRLLAKEGYEVVGVSNGDAAIKMLEDQGVIFDLLIVDIRMPGMDGLELLQRVKALDPAVEVIMMTGYSTVDSAVKAMKWGAYEYLTKPFEADELLHVVRNAFEKRSLQLEVKALKSRLIKETERPFIAGPSAAMRHVERFIQKVAQVDCNVLITGESGTGKEIVARAIHMSSSRRERPFVVADCAALSGTLLESELFGHLRGAFTGAHTDRKGYFETAHGGTLFLDEVAELPLDLQGKLLRAVQDQVIVKVGGTREIRVNTRIIASTNRDLEEMVKNGSFREDLFYRLNVVSLKIPPLRERKEDIPYLVKHFLTRFTAQFNVSQVSSIPPEAMEMLIQHDWPGNVRELENAIQRAVVLAENGVVSLRHLLPPKVTGSISYGHPLESGLNFREMKRMIVDDFSREYLSMCLRHYHGNVTRTAQALGLRRTSLQRLMKRYKLKGRQFRKNVSY
jgi:DNA-binding NtrC family response regulator